MAAGKLLNLIALATLAILATSFAPEPANALSNHGGMLQRDLHRGHDALAKRKRSNDLTRRCKNRPNSSGPVSSAVSVAPSSSVSIPVSLPTQGSGDNNSNSGGDSSNNNGGDNNGSNNNTGSDNNSNNGGNNSNSGSNNNNGGNSTPPPSGNNSGNGNTGSGKVCLAWPNGEDPALAKFATNNGGILYTWSPYLPTDLHGFHGVPMLWGPNQVDDFTKLVKPGYSNWVLGMNEPDQGGQSNMSPQDAAALWQQHIQPLASQGYKLVSPACTSDPRSKQWMKDFFTACSGCTFDAVAVHYYDTSADGLIAYLKDFHDTFGKPIWLTEFACQNFNGGAQCSYDEIQQFMSKAVNFMESTDWVQQYCWFGAMHDMVNVNYLNQLMSSDGSPTSLGWQYLSAH